MIDHIWTALVMLSSWNLMLTITICSIYGLFVGAVPGLTATMAAALLVPFTFFMDPLQALGVSGHCCILASSQSAEGERFPE